MKVGSKIKSFEIVEIIERTVNEYNDYGRKKKVNKTFALLLSDKGEERVLMSDKYKGGNTNLNDCQRYAPTFGKGLKFAKHNMI